MDQDDNKEYKKRVIEIFGSKYEITHKNNNIVNNNYSIYFGIIIYKIKSILYNTEFFRKILMIIGFILIIGLLIWAYIDTTIIKCMGTKIECNYILDSCNDNEFNIFYKCIFELNKYKLYVDGIFNIALIVFYAIVANVLLYLFAIICEKINIIFNYIINISINKYNEYVPCIENIL